MPFGMAPVWDRMSPLRPGAAVRSGDGFFAQLWAGKGEVLAQMWERTSLSQRRRRTGVSPASPGADGG
jgi:hypothetical protein